MTTETKTLAAHLPVKETAPPLAEDFARWPASWYLFCSSRDLRNGPRSKRMLGRDLVAYRAAGGRVVMMDARCSHLGADLGNGKVIGECIRCPFHEWEYAPDGRCTRIPNSTVIPPFARQTCYPSLERHGLVFFWSGREPLFPLPFFFDERPDEFRAGKPCRFHAACSWYMVTAHGFDEQHFETVHGRRLTGPLQVDTPSPFARRSRYRAQVLGEKFYDRFLRRFVGEEVDISITTWGGTFVVITGDFGRVRSRFLIVTQPLQAGGTLCEIIVFTHKRRNRFVGSIVEPLSLFLRRFLTRAYLVDEAQSLGSPEYNPFSLTPADREMTDFFRWAASLPQSSDRLPPRPNGTPLNELEERL